MTSQELFLLIYAVIIIIPLGYMIYLYGVTMFFGAPYVPTDRKKIEEMIKLSSLKKGDKMVDIGSGDGRIVIAFAKKGIESYGFEINPLLVWLSRRNIKKAGVEDKAFIHLKDFWKEDFSKFSLVTMYAIPHIMKRLYKKLKKELPKNAQIISSVFKFPNLPYSKNIDTLYLYKLKDE